jgi:predicted RNase H-like nuclease (RuvC/YqgF family)
MTDSMVESVLDKFKERSEEGIKKYGVTLDRKDLSPLEWLNHLQEELMDATLYIERLKKELEHLDRMNKILEL